MKAIGKIYLVWRKGKGSRRSIVGVIHKNATEGVRFEYIKGGVKKAMEDGFTPYIDFPEVDKVYSENVLEIFGQRLIKSERTDSQRFLDFWDIDPKYKEDKYYLLAYTQGMLSNDNFEFLADFQPVKDLKFVSEICGLSHRKLPAGTLAVSDKLIYELDYANKNDKFAVKVKKGNQPIGYVKMVHSRVFYKTKYPLQIKVKSIDQNGTINRVFIEISYF